MPQGTVLLVVVQSIMAVEISALGYFPVLFLNMLYAFTGV